MNKPYGLYRFPIVNGLKKNDAALRLSQRWWLSVLKIKKRGQASLRHTKRFADRCFLPDLAGLGNALLRRT